MKLKLSILSMLLMIAMCAVATAQSEQRIIRADRPDDVDEDDPPVLQVTGLKVGEQTVVLNESFVANENWLKELKITVKNVGDKDLGCIAIWMGVLEGLDTKLGPHESWGWKTNYTNGQCEKSKKPSSLLRKGESVDLVFYPLRFRTPDETPWPTLHKAILEWGSVQYKGEHGSNNVHSVRLLLPSDTKFLSDDSY